MKLSTRHGCLAFVILLSGAFFRLDPAAAEILFKADFETGDFSQFSGRSKNAKPGHIEVVSDIVHSGKYAGRFTIHEDNIFNKRQLRVQANGPKVTVEEGSDTFVSFYMSMKDAPKDRDNFFYWEGSPPPGYNNVMTWWVGPKEDGAGTFVRYGTGNLGRKGVHWEGDFTIGQWHQLGMHIHWSEDPAKGNVKLWWDGVVVLDKKVQTKGPQSVYFSQPGIHRDPHTKSVDTIYFDDFLCATTLDEIEIQKPNTAKSITGVSVAAHAQDSSKGVAAVLQPFVDRHEVAGAVILVADKDAVLGLDAVGYADIAAGSPMRTDAVFWIASQSKPITATALMMLVDEGKVKLDEPVARYLPEFREAWLAVERDKEHVLLKRPRHPITVREILSHTSGLPFKSALEEPTLDQLPLSVGAASYAMTPLQSEPGTKYQYSNAGINTAGRIIEVVSGMPYEAFLETRLFGPLGMSDTTFWPSGGQLARLAKAYKPGKEKTGLEVTTIDQLTYPLDDRHRRPMPAGGLFSTAADLARFCQMVLRGGEFQGRRYLSESAVKEMTTRQTGEEIKENYGLGWATGGGTFGHGGAFATNMTVNPKSGLITLFLVQHAGFPGAGGEAHGEFRKAAEKRFGPAKR